VTGNGQGIYLLIETEAGQIHTIFIRYIDLQTQNLLLLQLHLFTICTAISQNYLRQALYFALKPRIVTDANLYPCCPGKTR